MKYHNIILFVNSSTLKHYISTFVIPTDNALILLGTVIERLWFSSGIID